MRLSFPCYNNGLFSRVSFYLVHVHFINPLRLQRNFTFHVPRNILLLVIFEFAVICFEHIVAALYMDLSISIDHVFNMVNVPRPLKIRPEKNLQIQVELYC